MDSSEYRVERALRKEHAGSFVARDLLGGGTDMRLVIGQFSELSDKILKYGAQLGFKGVTVNGLLVDSPMLPGDVRWEFTDLVRLRMWCEEHGMRLEAIENLPYRFYDKAMLGLPGRDEQIENCQATIHNLGRAGIEILGFHWMPNFDLVWRTSTTDLGRGGAQVTSFDMDLAQRGTTTHQRVFGAEEMWSNFERFVRAIVPAAEEAGVRLALHPDDPPVPSLGGIARIFSTVQGLQRGINLCPSPCLGLLLCTGTFSSMGIDVLETIRLFAEAKKIVYVHFRDVQGAVPKFQECFLGEGNINPAEALRVLKHTGFDGFIMDDHVPLLDGDTGWGERGRAYASGYLTGLLAALETLDVKGARLEVR